MAEIRKTEDKNNKRTTKKEATKKRETKKEVSKKRVSQKEKELIDVSNIQATQNGKLLEEDLKHTRGSLRNSKKRQAKTKIGRLDSKQGNGKIPVGDEGKENKESKRKFFSIQKEEGLALNQKKSTKQHSVYLGKSLKRKKKKDKKSIKELTLTVDIFDVLIAIIATAICSCVITGFILNTQYKKNNPLYASNLTSNHYIGKFIKIYSEVVDNFYEEVEEDGLIEAAIEGMMKHLEDNYSIYMNKEEGSSFTEDLDDQYEGIGVIAYGNLIYSVIPKSPAEKVGLQEGDLIIQINEIEINEENYNSVAGIIGDSEGDIQLKVVRDNKELDFTIQKSTVIMNVVEGQTLKKNKKTIGYIRLSSFGAASYSQFQEELLRLEQENIDSLIIDLRGNTGGYLNMASDISSLFLENGKLIYSLENKNGITDYKDKTVEKREYEIVVIVNESTASAAEILTAALKDSYGAYLVGKKTYGKGKVQNVIHNEGSVVKYTSAKWLRPNGECIDEVGIVPDYEITNVIKDEIVYDKQLEKAIELLR